MRAQTRRNIYLCYYYAVYRGRIDAMQPSNRGPVRSFVWRMAAVAQRTENECALFLTSGPIIFQTLMIFKLHF